MTETTAARPHVRRRRSAVSALRGAVLTIGVLTLLITSSSIAAACPTVAARPAAAPAPPEQVVELSADGTTYSRSLTDLFGPVSLSPGDHVEGSLWVRNAGARPARLTLTVTDVGVSDPETLQALSLTSGPADRPGGVVPLAEVARYATLSAGENLDPGEAIMIVSTLALGDLSGQQGQQSTVDLTVRVTLSGAATGSAPGTEPVATDTAPEPPGTAPALPGATLPGSSESGPLASSTEGGLLAQTWDARLASTGGVAVASTVVAGALVALGLLLWFAARRRRDGDSEPEGGGAPESAVGEDRA